LCKVSATADDVRAAMPHPVVGSAAAPIALEPVDDVVVTTPVDHRLEQRPRRHAAAQPWCGESLLLRLA
jgi:hypothetical protein